MLTDRERAILDFEGRWWQQRGAKENEIATTFEVSATRYYQLLARLITRPEAVAYAPTTVNRLRRISTRRPGAAH
jgi:hypothetical protein